MYNYFFSYSCAISCNIYDFCYCLSLQCRAKKICISNECAFLSKPGLVLIRKWCEISSKKIYNFIETLSLNEKLWTLVDLLIFIFIWGFSKETTEAFMNELILHLELIRRLDNFLFYKYDWWNNYYKIWFVFFEHLKLPKIYIYKVAWLTFN